MTNQIDDLMRLADKYWASVEAGTAERHVLQRALEVALKPGDKVATMQSIVDSNTGFKRDTAPPAQTPPTHLSIGGLDEIYRESFGLIDSRLVGDQIKFARAIESAVRRSFGVQE